MEANPKVKSHMGQAGCDECYSPPEERVVSDRAAPCSLCTSYFGGLCQRILRPPQGLALPCSKGFAMVTSWASCCSQENRASDHGTRSRGSWPWIRKHWGRRERCDVQLHLPVPQTQKLYCVPLSGRPSGGFGGCEKNIRTRPSESP